MSRRNTRLLTVGIALALVVVACGGDAEETTTAAPAATTTGATETTAAAAPETTSGGTETTTAADVPTELRMAMIAVDVVDDPWYGTMLDSMERAKQASPYGLEVTYEWFENIDYADGERVIRDLAVSGKYDLIVGHSTYGDAVAAVKDEFPEIAFVFSGSGNEPTGGNGFWIDAFGHEPAYLAGVAAGLMTETDRVGVVANFPFPNVNAPVNAFIDGARSVNPDVQASATFIESWWDPVTAKESALAQISAGADVIYGIVFGVVEAAGEAGVYAVGDYDDQQYLDPDVVITSNMALWDPALNAVIDGWWNQHANGVPMDAPTERLLFFMPDGGSDIAPLNEALVPADVQSVVMDLRQQILDGELTIDLNEAPPE